MICETSEYNMQEKLSSFSYDMRVIPARPVLVKLITISYCACARVSIVLQIVPRFRGNNKTTQMS